jgi:hypothetical protein
MIGQNTQERAGDSEFHQCLRELEEIREKRRRKHMEGQRASRPAPRRTAPPSDHLTFLVTAKGEPFTAAGFGNYFRALCDAAGLPKRCTTHGLRKAAATYFAEKNATDHQLMAWFG